jgi:hypothetical protein
VLVGVAICGLADIGGLWANRRKMNLNRIEGAHERACSDRED